ncbi:MAG: hypothetical protein BRC33_10705 [Cyanobacteria bacterium SW_9_44_58]|nr:MAG: hypothetical protein BRC33_10705 [Cyanobacteria bacterium SW_9_44_58]
MRLHGHAYFNLLSFLLSVPYWSENCYKGIKEGVKVVAIPPAFTSKTCHCCLQIGVRTEKRFKCSNLRCGWIGDADLNGAKNIELWGCCVNQPGGSCLLSCDIDGGLLKASSSDEVG